MMFPHSQKTKPLQVDSNIVVNSSSVYFALGEVCFLVLGNSFQLVWEEILLATPCVGTDGRFGLLPRCTHIPRSRGRACPLGNPSFLTVRWVLPPQVIESAGNPASLFWSSWISSPSSGDQSLRLLLGAGFSFAPMAPSILSGCLGYPQLRLAVGVGKYVSRRRRNPIYSKLQDD